MTRSNAALRNLAAWCAALAAGALGAGLWLASRPGAPLSSLGLPGFDSAYLGLAALVPLMIWLEVVPQRVSAWAGALGALALGATMAWLAAYGAALSVLPGLVRVGYPEVDARASAALAAGMQALPVAVATTLTWLAVRRGRRAPGFFVFAWVAAEGLAPLGSERLAVAFYEHPEWIALASLGGPALVSLQLALVNGALAECLLVAIPPRRKPYLVVAALVAMGGSLGIHMVRTGALAVATDRAPTLDILLVQPAPGDDAGLEASTRAALADIPRDDKPHVVVWPSAELESPLGWSELDLATRLPARLDIPFLVGSPLSRGEASDEPEVHALVRTDEGRQRQAVYEATVLAPFLDFAPLEESLPASMRARIHDAGRRPGQRGAMFELVAVPFGVMVAWDDISGPALRRQLDDQDPEWLLSVVDDRAFVGTPLPEYHHACAVFRSVEQGRYLLRAAAEGGSSLIDPLGAVQTRLPLAEGVATVIHVPRLHAETGYRAVGNFATLLCLLFALSLVMLRPPAIGPEGANSEDA